MLITCTRARTALIRTFHPALRRSRGLVALVRLGGSSSIARGGNGRPCVLNVLANLCDDVRANCDIPAILQALGALGCASSLEYLFETLWDDPDPVKLVSLKEAAPAFFMPLKQAAANAQLAATPPLIASPVYLTVSSDSQAERPDACSDAERTALMVLPTITWEQVARQQLQTVNGAEYARELLRQRAAHAQPLSYGRG